MILEITPHKNNDKLLSLKATALQDAIQQKVQTMFGDFGVAAIKAAFRSRYCNTHTKIAMIKAGHGPHKFLLRAIPLINDISGRHVKISILYVGATMKHCFLFIRKHQEKKLEQIWASLRTETERKEMEKVLMTLTPAMKDFISK
ncbi:PREDICTED: uncharacterized protein LOC106746996 isoform X2 [Dinoponera quadriceps]|nr:PREDICTED: uncharacterized protein LOC106746996 isoform X2 [Dinoponera quadriceps]